MRANTAPAGTTGGQTPPLSGVGCSLAHKVPTDSRAYAAFMPCPLWGC